MNLPGVTSFLQLTHILTQFGGRWSDCTGTCCSALCVHSIQGARFKGEHFMCHPKMEMSYHTFCSVPQVIICTDGLANKGVGHLDGKLVSSLCTASISVYPLSPDWWLIVIYHHRSNYRWGPGCCPDILWRPWSTGTWEKVCTVVKCIIMASWE